MAWRTGILPRSATREGFSLSSAPGVYMLFDDITIEEIAEIRYNEGLEDGREEGREYGLERGREDRELEIARNLLAEGSAPDFVHRITGLPMEKIEKM